MDRANGDKILRVGTPKNGAQVRMAHLSFKKTIR